MDVDDGEAMKLLPTNAIVDDDDIVMVLFQFTACELRSTFVPWMTRFPLYI